MDEPDIFPDYFDHYTTQDVSDLMEWARENKKRADRLLAAAKFVCYEQTMRVAPSDAALDELWLAAIDYKKENKECAE
jgi:hypothetical protein